MSLNPKFAHYVHCATNCVHRHLSDGCKVYAFMAGNQASCMADDAVFALRRHPAVAAQRRSNIAISHDQSSHDVIVGTWWLPAITLLFEDGSEHSGAVVLDAEFNVVGVLEGEGESCFPTLIPPSP